MINLTRINRVPLVLNSDLIEYIEKTPDTVVSLTNGLKLLVLESPDDIVARVVAFRRRILDGFLESSAGPLERQYYPFSAMQPALSHASKASEEK
jgi:flagellar protein FlbD